MKNTTAAVLAPVPGGGSKISPSIVEKSRATGHAVEARAAPCSTHRLSRCYSGLRATSRAGKASLSLSDRGALCSPQRRLRGRLLMTIRGPRARLGVWQTCWERSSSQSAAFPPDFDLRLPRAPPALLGDNSTPLDPFIDRRLRPPPSPNSFRLLCPLLYVLGALRLGRIAMVVGALRVAV